MSHDAGSARPPAGELLASFRVPSRPGSERQVRRRVAVAAQAVGASREAVERLELAVAEVTRNAAEHGNLDRPDLPVDVEVWHVSDHLVVRVQDRAVGAAAAAAPCRLTASGPDEGDDPRGFGLALVAGLVDRQRRWRRDGRHTVELTIWLTPQSVPRRVPTPPPVPGSVEVRHRD